MALPTEVLTAIGGGAVTIGGAFLASKLKAIPLNIYFGKGRKNGSAFVTGDQLTANCERRELLVNSKLSDIHETNKEILVKIDKHGEDIAFIKGKLS